MEGAAVLPTMPRKKPAREISFSNVEKVFFPSGFTKGEMIKYYLEAAPFILPHLKDRPITLIRFPNGVRGESFYEKNAPGFAPDWIETYKVPRREHEGFINYILVNSAETLAWCANIAALELHPFLHQAPDLDRPTHVAFDLDPGEGADILPAPKWRSSCAMYSPASDCSPSPRSPAQRVFNSTSRCIRR